MQALLDSDVFMPDKKTICVQKLLSKMWENRSNMDIVNVIADLLCLFTAEKRVFSDIEFYMPQLAHLIIHLDQMSKDPGLERLAMVICQSSTHAALQMSFLFEAALEDYQPESINGQHNKNCNPFFFARCARLLQDLERAVIFGSNTVASNEEKEALRKRMSLDPVHRGSIDDMDAATLQSEMVEFKKQAIASKLARTNSFQSNDGLLNGTLLFKRNIRKSRFHLKGWKPRHFVVDNRVLLCFREPHSVNPLRTISLQACQVEVIHEDEQYGETRFDVVNYSNNNRFQLRAKDEKSRNDWVSFLRSEILGAPQVAIEDGLESPAQGGSAAAAPGSPGGGCSMNEFGEKVRKTPIIQEDEMTAEQRRRFNYFKQMRIMLTNLTNISERLRFKDPAVRKFFLRRDMKDIAVPPLAYLPLGGSLSPFTQILRTLPTEGHSFTTKARCPALMMFELQEHPAHIDTATFLNFEVENYRDNQVINRRVEITCGASSAWEDEDEDAIVLDPPAAPGAAAAAEGANSNAGAAATAVVTLEDENSLTRSISSSGTSSTRQPPVALDTHLLSNRKSCWSPEGTGIVRLDSRGLTLPPHVTPPASEKGDSCIITSTLTKLEEKYIPAGYRLSLGSHSGEEALSHEKVTIDLEKEDTTSSPGGVSSSSNEVVSAAVSGTIIGETFPEKAARLQAKSPYGKLPGWKLGGLIAKSNDDVRQEVFVMQLIRYYQRAFSEANLPCWLYTYTILSTSQSTGLIQLIPNATSLDGLKKSNGYPGSLRSYFETTYGFVAGRPEPPAFRTAMNNYINSMSAYSVVSYLIGIKDRHNGNVMIDTEGHLIHIDFGFVFGLAPGKAFSMEKAPWKLTKEMADVMGGVKSADFIEYQRQCTQALLVARRHAKQVKSLMEMMSHHSSYPAFQYNRHAIRDFMYRLMLDIPDKDVEKKVGAMMRKSYNHQGTNLYDKFQLATNGIAV